MPKSRCVYSDASKFTLRLTAGSLSIGVPYNIYYKNEDDYLIRLGGKNYGKNEFEAYQAEQDNDRGSRVENIFA